MKQLEDFYFFERYFAAHCNDICNDRFSSTIGINFSGELRSRRCCDEPDVFAYRFCKALIHAGLDSDKLRKTYRENLQFTISRDVLISTGLLKPQSPESEKIDHVIRFCNEKLQTFFVQM